MCFDGSNTSKSFKVPVFKQEESEESNINLAPAKMIMSFGSGEISAEIASDRVSVASVATYMENGVLLMVDHGLEIRSHFEGILGLGRPNLNKDFLERPGQPEGLRVPGFFDSASVNRFSICFNHGADGVLGINTRSHHNRMTSVGKTHWGLDFAGISIGNQKMKLGSCEHKRPEMETACSIIPDTGTTLVVGPEAQIAILYEELCNEWQRCQITHAEMRKEIQELRKKGVKIEGPAGSIDLHQMDPVALEEVVSRVVARSSKETGPLFDVDTAENDVLGQPRNQSEMETPESDPAKAFDLEDDGGFTLPPSLTLQLLLEHCSSWIADVDLDEDMPKLTFHVGDTKGHTDELVLKPSSYVFSKAVDVEVPSIRKIRGFPMKVRSPKTSQVCMMGFSAMDYSTEMNGDVWIFGTPLFYEYTAHYDRGTGNSEDITMGFTPRAKADCGHCKGNKIHQASESLLDQKRSKVGLGALNHLSKDPIIRNLPGKMSYI